MAEPVTIEQQARTAGAQPTELRRRAPLPLSGIPVFNYHGLGDGLSSGIPRDAQRFWLRPSQFRDHLAHIREAGFHVATLGELEAVSSGRVRRGPAVVLTFDDGLTSDYEFAFPLLVEFGMRGVFFVNPSTVGGAGYLSWAQIAEMSKAGMAIQSHSHHHLDLTVLPRKALESELADSKRSLEDHLGRTVEFLAAPHGLLNRRVVRSALASGYRAVCSTRCWPANPRSRVFTRITLHRDIGMDEFHAFLTGEVSIYARRLYRGMLHRPRRIAGHLAGIIRYRWLRQAAPVSK
ncbi:MAG TPA: polysaccharide deacetylase family protein [Terriglobia bacterium]|nr:polysaccharide deacetylase family protein [Terriglobia bacterium]